jgi:hypothetical protein
VTTLAALERFVRQPPRPSPEGGRERCGLCAGAIEEPHRHFVSPAERRILCACRACWLGGGAGLSAVPERVVRDPGFVVDDAHWAALKVPVRLAFLFFNSVLRRWVAVFPGPAGPTEAELDPPSWFTDAALPRQVVPDVEALLIHGKIGRPLEALLVPIDVCYELVGRVRLRWRGFHGGDEAWREIDAFFERLRARSR